MSAYRLDRTAFKAQTAEDAAKHVSYYARLSWQERLTISAYLISVAYDYPLSNPPKLDRTKFQAKGRK